MKRATRQGGSSIRTGSLESATHPANGADAKERRKRAGTWLKDLRQRAGLSQIELADRLGFKYYTFVSQIENGFGRVPTESMEAWAKNLGADPAKFTRELLSYYEPELHRLLFEVKK
jgi:DNA-binding XRE family transcriptional regulator